MENTIRNAKLPYFGPTSQGFIVPWNSGAQEWRIRGPLWANIVAFTQFGPICLGGPRKPIHPVWARNPRSGELKHEPQTQPPRWLWLVDRGRLVTLVLNLWVATLGFPHLIGHHSGHQTYLDIVYVMRL